MNSRYLLVLTLVSAMAQSRPYTQTDLYQRDALPYQQHRRDLVRYLEDRLPREIAPGSEYSRRRPRDDDDSTSGDRLRTACTPVLYQNRRLPKAEYYRSGEIINPGYLYNRGTGKYLKVRQHPETNAVLIDGREDTPSAVAFVGSTEGDQVFYSLVLLPDNDTSTDRYQLFQNNRQRPYQRLFATANRDEIQLSFDTPEDRDLLDGEFLPTLPYYDNDRAVKIVHKTQCLDVKNNRQLVLRSCIDDDDYGRPTLDNDRQLFVWCPVQQRHLCEQDYPQTSCSWQ